MFPYILPLLEALPTFLVNVRPAIVLDDGEETLFTNMNGKPMSRQGFWKIIKHYADSKFHPMANR